LKIQRSLCQMNWQIVNLTILAYLIGSIPFGLIVSRLKGVDIRQHGSGNIGASNVFRTMGWPYGCGVFILDALKGYGPTLLALGMTEHAIVHISIGLLTVIGHSLTVFAHFKGGKGAATALGMLLALSPDVFLIVFIIAIALILITRYVAPVTLFCSLLTPILLYVFDYPIEYVGIVSVMAIFIFIRHKENIKRLLRGEENKI
jgi:acyl phosphate:glycerol-3-phosphate acyltransferase